MRHPAEADIWTAMKKGCAPPPRESPVAWTERTVPQVLSARSSMVDFGQTPWFRDPFEAFADNTVREINIVAPVGSGKTTFLEAAISYAVARDPGPMLGGVLSEAEA
jgi:phage terminase large subunit GpA-like protein